MRKPFLGVLELKPRDDDDLLEQRREGLLCMRKALALAMNRIPSTFQLL